VAPFGLDLPLSPPLSPWEAAPLILSASRLNYAETRSRRQQDEFARLRRWQPPSWERHFLEVAPLFDYAPA
jgi:hypothetical protein